MSEDKPDPDRQKLLDIVAAVRVLLSDCEVVGVLTLAGRAGSLENHFLFDAPWFKIITDESGDKMGLRLMLAATDPIEVAGDTLGALRGLAELQGFNGLGMMRASEVMDDAVGAEHTPMTKVKKH